MQNRLKRLVKLQKSNADEDSEAIKLDMLKARFLGQERYPAGNMRFQQAIEARPCRLLLHHNSS
jgi:hypothetical protein